MVVIFLLVCDNKKSWRRLWCWLVTIACSTCLSTPVSIPAEHLLHHSLHHFEVLHKRHLQHRNVVGTQRSMHFSTLDRKFKLQLTSRKGLFEEGLEVKSVGVNGETNRHVLDVSHFYSGVVEEEVGSRVSAHYDPNEGVLTASIHTETEHYFIEPSQRHFNQSHDFHMITYRASDLKLNITGKPFTSFCGSGPLPSPVIKQSLPPYAPPLPPAVFPHSSPSHADRASRLRRQATPLSRSSCPMHLVGTGWFHQAFTDQNSRNRNVEGTILFMVQVIDDIDMNIFRPVMWQEGINNFGLSIQNITVYESPDTGPPYNEGRGGTGWVSGQMLRLFSHADWSEVCLAHLFTFQDFTDNLVGVAYPATTTNSPGGICSQAIPDFNGGAIATANVGLSSYQGDGGRFLLQGEARLITAHEIGHNWGSEHDPTGAIGVCNPVISNQEGKFLMFPSMTDGTQPNNDVFSPCSVSSIGEVLRAKSQECFREPMQTQCGNYEIEGDEACDAGLQGTIGTDPCCDEHCHLKTGKNCSDSNHECCTDCSISGPEVVCRVFSESNIHCYANVTCDGVSKTCPSEIPSVPVNSSCRGGVCLFSGTICNDSGQCMGPPLSTPTPKLECYNFCQMRNLTQCFCTNEEDECHFCCQSGPSSPCRVMQTSEGRERLPDGTTCVGGLCRGGVCMPVTQDLINRLFRLFRDISVDEFFLFVSENIVGTVLFLTSLIWIIVGSIISCIDLRNFNEYRKKVTELEEELLHNYNEDQLDHTFVDGLALTTPQIDASQTKRGLSRMGSRSDMSIMSRRGVSRQYSVSKGSLQTNQISRQFSVGKGSFQPNRMVHGHRLSSVLEKSREMDPSTSNIMGHIHGAEKELKLADAPKRRAQPAKPSSSRKPPLHVSPDSSYSTQV